MQQPTSALAEYYYVFFPESQKRYYITTEIRTSVFPVKFHSNKFREKENINGKELAGAAGFLPSKLISLTLCFKRVSSSHKIYRRQKM
jgi:hypothetical protein